MSEVTNDGESAPHNAGTKLLARLAGPHGMGQAVALIVLLPLTIGTLINDPQRSVVGFDVWLGVAAQALVAAWVAFTLLGFLIRRVSRSGSVVRGVLQIGAYAAVEIMRTSVVGLVAQTVDARVVINWTYRIVAGGFTGIVLFALVAALVENRRQYVVAVRELLVSQETLRKNLQTSERDLALRRENLLSGVRQLIENALREVASKASSGGLSLQRTIEELVRISNEVVRPLSHELYQMPESFLEKKISKPRVSFARAIELASVLKPYRPELVVSLTFFLLVGASLFLGSQPLVGFLSLCTLMAAIYGLLWLLRRFLQPLLMRVTYPRRFMWVLLSFAVMPVVVWAGAQSILGLDIGFWGYVYVLLIGFIVQMALAFPPGLEAARDEALASLETANGRLRWLNARLGAVLWSERKAVARSLHRDVQGVLVAASFRLQRALANDENVDAPLNEVRELVELAASFVVQSSPIPHFAAVMEQLDQQWHGVIEITTDISPEVVTILDSDPVARQSFSDVVAEFITNSVKHGHSSQARITGSRLGDGDVVKIQCTNNGEPLEPSATIRAGLGQRMLETFSVTRSFTNTTAGVQLSVELPVEA